MVDKPQSSTPEPEFVLVYDSASPKSLHARSEKECWGAHMREATPEELEQLQGARCKHCVSRLAKAGQESQPEKPKREPLPRNQAKPAQSAPEKLAVAA